MALPIIIAFRFLKMFPTTPLLSGQEEIQTGRSPKICPAI